MIHVSLQLSSVAAESSSCYRATGANLYVFDDRHLKPAQEDKVTLARSC